MNIECIGYQHAFNNQKRRDYHRDPSATLKWIACEHYICPQRYQRIQTEIRLGGAYKIPQPSQEGPVRAEHPGTKFPEVLPPIRTPVGSPVATTSKNLLVEGPENPQESEVEEEGSEDESSDHEEPPRTDKGKEPEHEQEQNDTNKPMDTEGHQQLQEIEYRFDWKGHDFHGFFDPDEKGAMAKEMANWEITFSNKEEEKEFQKHFVRNSHQYPFADRLQHVGIGKFGRPANAKPTPSESASAAFGSIRPHLNPFPSFGSNPFPPRAFALSTSPPKEPPPNKPNDNLGKGDDDAGRDRDEGGPGGGNGGGDIPRPGRGPGGGEPGGGGPGGGGPGGGGPGGGDPGGPQYLTIPNAQPQRGRVKIKEPEVYNGDRSKLEAFLDQIFLVFMGDPEKYATDKARVAYALSYLGEGAIKYWKTHQIAQIRHDPRNMPSWTDFENLLHKSYTPLNQVNNAMLDLEELSLEDFEDIHAFNAHFNMLIEYSHILDGQICMSYYWNALPSWLWKKISMLFPVPTNIVAWIGRATDIYEQDLINRKIDGNLRKRRPRRKATQAKVRRNIRDPPQKPKSITATDTSANANVNKMTLEERSRHLQQNLCFFCHKPGHQARECPNRAKGGKPGRRVNRKVRQVIAEDSETGEGHDEDNSEESAEEQSEDDEYQVDAIQQDFDPDETDF